jgi:peroxiredoxin
MPPKLAMMMAGTLLVAAAAVGILIPIMGGLEGPPNPPERSDASRETRDAPRSPDAPRSSDALPRSAASPVSGDTPRSANARPRAGQVYSLEEAITRLDLIKPARQKIADDFTLPTPAGGTFKLSDQRGKVVLINFWATWCPPCLQEMPAMERLYRQHKDAGFEMVAVSVDADTAKVKPFLAAHKFTFRIVMDAPMALANTYGVRALPSSFIVDRKGTLAALAIGPRHWDNDASHSLVEALVR